MAFGIGGEFGKAVISWRTANGWSAPVFMELAKGSIGSRSVRRRISFYGASVSPQAVIAGGKVTTPTAVRVFVNALGADTRATTGAK